MARPIMFKCPSTGMNVQHWLAAPADTSERMYQSVVCAACAKLHLLDSSTGKLLGEATNPLSG
ncbi:hypothetical protein DXU07_05505 [Bradyrhizobium elkanii]|jgi:hypothetical protein|nr:hypothetical protein [Bradyrhizobium elkanii]NWL68236.1 hypothetical protein [Bradyrhizobium elkanii]QOZ16089.1 hypothetical protein XI02_14725 [Bradyrhizobium sp. CCBAU 21365]RYM24221.1 hypothetical protein EWH13_19155 [Bradyrhizobium elkanii]BBC01831.1 hypothetical protein BE61_72920 [Bradyrhizobium elkanii USDA 61]